VSRERSARSSSEEHRGHPIEHTKGDLEAGPIPVLDVVDIQKWFGGFHVLAGASLQVRSGSTVALIGPNGSGKSTLLNVICGLESTSSGVIRLNGVDLGKQAPDERARSGLARTFQQPRVYAGMTVIENLMVGAHIFGETGLFTTLLKPGRSWRENQKALASARQVLDLVQLSRNKWDSRVDLLPLRDQRAVELARALMMEPQLLLLDEPTTGMDPAERPAWISHIRGLRESLGMSIVIVEHSMKVVAEVADWVVVLSSGQVLAAGVAKDVLADEQVRTIYIGKGTGPVLQADHRLLDPDREIKVRSGGAQPAARTLDQQAGDHGRQPGAPTDVTTAGGESVSDSRCALRVENLSAGYGKLTVLHGVTLHMNWNAVTTVIGLNGAGKTTLARTLSGVLPVQNGEIEFDGMDLTQVRGSKVARLGIVQVLDDRQLFSDLTVQENLILAYRVGRKHADQGRSVVLDPIFEILPRLKERIRQVAGSMSGGEQQMLALGRALACQPRLLILDEPSTGLSPVMIEEIYAALTRLREAGLAMLLIEQDVERALAFSDYAYVLTSGEISSEGPANQVAGRADIADLLFVT
jgi:branched-chain amino acid transport system ATP-binding protein